jgi:hypothetical protein
VSIVICGNWISTVACPIRVIIVCSIVDYDDKLSCNLLLCWWRIS